MAVPSEPFIRLSDHVRWVEREDTIVVLDLQSGRFLGLRGAACSAWKAIAHGRGNLAEQAGDPTTSFFVSECKRHGLITDLAPPKLAPNRLYGTREPTLFGAGVALLSARVGLRIFGFGSTYAFLGRRALRHSVLPVPSMALINHILQSFVRAESIMPSSLAHDDCLPRSLALFSFLRSAGVPVTHIIGVMDRSFGGHAWVSLEGRPLLDDSDRVRQFTPIATLSAA